MTEKRARSHIPGSGQNHQTAGFDGGRRTKSWILPDRLGRHLIDKVKSAVVIGGGLGTAIAYPQAKKLHSMGVRVDSIIGFRNKDLVFMEEEMGKVSDRLLVMTDDGSNGNKGFVTDALKRLIDEGGSYDIAIAIGPLVMMKFVSKLTREYNIKTIVSMNLL